MCRIYLTTELESNLKKFASGKEYYRYIASITEFAQQLTEEKKDLWKWHYNNCNK